MVNLNLIYHDINTFSEKNLTSIFPAETISRAFTENACKAWTDNFPTMRQKLIKAVVTYLFFRVQQETFSLLLDRDNEPRYGLSAVLSLTLGNCFLYYFAYKLPEEIDSYQHDQSCGITDRTIRYMVNTFSSQKEAETKKIIFDHIKNLSLLAGVVCQNEKDPCGVKDYFYKDNPLFQTYQKMEEEGHISQETRQAFQYVDLANTLGADAESFSSKTITRLTEKPLKIFFRFQNGRALVNNHIEFPLDSDHTTVYTPLNHPEVLKDKKSLSHAQAISFQAYEKIYNLILQIRKKHESNLFTESI